MAWAQATRGGAGRRPAREGTPCPLYALPPRRFLGVLWGWGGVSGGGGCWGWGWFWWCSGGLPRWGWLLVWGWGVGGA